MALADLLARNVTVTPTAGDRQYLLNAFKAAGWTRRTRTLPGLMSWVDRDDTDWPPHTLPPAGVRRVTWDGLTATVQQAVTPVEWRRLMVIRPSSAGQLLRVLAAADVLPEAVTR